MLKQSILVLEKAIRDGKRNKNGINLSEKDAIDILKYLSSLQDFKTQFDKVK